MPEDTRTPEERFDSKVARTDQCWQWLGAIGGNGYGYFRIAGKRKGAHRVAYERWVGKIPNGLLVDHVCHNPQCVRPDHLRLVTKKQNGEHRVGPNRDNTTSGIRGVRKDQRRDQKSWYGAVVHNGHYHYTKYFATTDEAERAVISLRNDLYTHNDFDRHTPPRSPTATT